MRVLTILWRLALLGGVAILCSAVVPSIPWLYWLYWLCILVGAIFIIRET